MCRDRCKFTINLHILYIFHPFCIFLWRGLPGSYSRWLARFQYEMLSSHVICAQAAVAQGITPNVVTSHCWMALCPCCFFESQRRPCHSWALEVHIVDRRRSAQWEWWGCKALDARLSIGPFRSPSWKLSAHYPNAAENGCVNGWLFFHWCDFDTMLPNKNDKLWLRYETSMKAGVQPSIRSLARYSYRSNQLIFRVDPSSWRLSNCAISDEHGMKHES